MQVYLFQSDLRIYDQPLLEKALNNGSVIGLYIFEKDYLNKTKYGFLKNGLMKRKFLYDSLYDLKINLSNLNIPLLSIIGNTKDTLSKLSKYFKIDSIYYEELPGSIEKKKYTQIEDLGIKTISMKIKPLYYENELPLKVMNMPFIFSSFRKKIESFSTNYYRKTTPIKHFETNQNIPNWWVSSNDLGIDNLSSKFKGGETSALERIKYYFYDSKKILNYKFTRNGLLNFNDSSKFSMYLSHGCISAKRIYFELKNFEKNVKKNISTYWLYFELLWRDFFYYTHLKYGNDIFHKGGFFKKTTDFRKNKFLLNSVISGSTGYPLIDSSVKELTSTGYMSNRARQNFANFFSKQLKLDWRIGALFFESYLIDYDVSSNTLNWLYASGIGNDPIEHRLFNVSLQGKKYDKNAEYVKTYLPILSNVPNKLIYDIPDITLKDRIDLKIENYPKPIIRRKS